VTILILFAFLTGCSGGLFDYNLFQDIGVVKPDVTAPTKSAAAQDNAEQETTLATLAGDLASPSYLAALRADPVNLPKVETYLQDLYKGAGGSDAVVQEAAVLYANLNLDTTGGTQVVQNIVGTLMNSQGLALKTEADVSALIKAILPTSVNSAGTFATLVQGLINANDAYMALAGTITDPAHAMVASDINMGDTAQKALVSYAVSHVVELWLPSGTTVDTATSDQIAAAAGGLWAFLGNPADPSTRPTGVIAGVLDTSAPGFTNVKNLFQVAGLDLTTYLTK